MNQQEKAETRSCPVSTKGQLAIFRNSGFHRPCEGNKNQPPQSVSVLLYKKKFTALNQHHSTQNGTVPRLIPREPFHSDPEPERPSTLHNGKVSLPVSTIKVIQTLSYSPESPSLKTQGEQVPIMKSHQTMDTYILQEKKRKNSALYNKPCLDNKLE